MDRALLDGKTYFCVFYDLADKEDMLVRHFHTDTLLLDRLREGDTKAFDALFRQYYPLLCAYGCRFVCLENAEEIAQDTMLWLWEKREMLEGVQSAKSYLFSAVYHRAMSRIKDDELRQQAHEAYYKRTTALLEDVDVCLLNDLSRHIREAVAQLPPTYREAFVLNRFRNMTYDEIGKQLGVSPRTAEYRIRKAMQLLREELKEYFPLALLLLELRLVF